MSMQKMVFEGHKMSKICRRKAIPWKYMFVFLLDFTESTKEHIDPGSALAWAHTGHLKSLAIAEPKLT